MLQKNKAVILLVFFFNISFCILAQNITLPVCKNRFIVIAHRGDHTNAAENTLTAYQNAIDAGADFVEIDLRTTKDSQLVIMHNSTINYMTEAKGNVSDYMFDSLRKIPVHDPQHPEWGKYTIPTFKEVLQLCKGKINIYLDFKNASVKSAYHEIVNAGMERNVIVYINEVHQFAEWRNIAPAMPLMISLPSQIKTKHEMYALLDSLQIDILDGNFDEYNIATVLAAKEKNIPIWADIQSKDENAERWDRALVLGLAGLQTDHPAALIGYLKLKGMR
ncbi:glycerophosphodiester phosphodiesterase family protein [Ferruginibacter sp. SUN106]|uniref:glycerophosphodiester phosphodiesterase family protein n=1 Tax=Ferruginibacter sp. SUN106 TaxID=2978348 RepID=UPI003D365AD8